MTLLTEDTMRYYRIDSVGDDSSNRSRGIRYTKSLIFVMANNNDSGGNVTSWCRANKFKLIALLMALLVAVQYLFGASIYNVRIFDYKISQIYIWTGNAVPKDNAATNEDLLIDGNLTTSSPLTVASFVANHTLLSNSSGYLDTTRSSNLPSTTVRASYASSTTTSSTSLRSSLPHNTSSSPVCPVLPSGLVGPIKVWFDYPSYEELAKLYPDLEAGGHGKPKECVSRHKVAVIIPYRDRDMHLRGFLHNMHSLLRKQQLDYAIYVVEQIPDQTFNRAKLMNVGFAEAMKQYQWQCAIFHDVDLLPEDDRNIYSCPEQPRHMSVAVDKFKYRLPYTDIFGGISALTAEQFRTVNGFSNDYWGWGGEDDDMASRVKLNKYQITRYPAHIARYMMIKHMKEKANPVNACRYNLMYKVTMRWRKDGLSNLNYKVVSLEKRRLFTRVLVDLLETESRKRLIQEKVCVTHQPRK